MEGEKKINVPRRKKCLEMASEAKRLRQGGRVLTAGADQKNSRSRKSQQKNRHLISKKKGKRREAIEKTRRLKTEKKQVRAEGGWFGEEKRLE